MRHKPGKDNNRDTKHMRERLGMKGGRGENGWVSIVGRHRTRVYAGDSCPASTQRAKDVCKTSWETCHKGYIAALIAGLLLVPLSKASKGGHHLGVGAAAALTPLPPLPGAASLPLTSLLPLLW